MRLIESVTVCQPKWRWIARMRAPFVTDDLGRQRRRQCGRRRIEKHALAARSHANPRPWHVRKRQSPRLRGSAYVLALIATTHRGYVIDTALQRYHGVKVLARATRKGRPERMLD